MSFRIIPFSLALIIVAFVVWGCGSAGKFAKRGETSSESSSLEEIVPEPELDESDFVEFSGEPEQLTFGEHPSAFGSIHPDGDKIVFQSLIDNQWQLLLMDLSNVSLEEDAENDESNRASYEVVRLLETSNNDESPIWSSDGESVIFVSSQVESKEIDRDIFLYDPTAEVILPVVESAGDDWSPSVIADNDILFLSERNADSELSKYQKPNGLYRTDKDGNIQKIAGAYSDYCCPVVVDDNHVVVLNKDDRLVLLSLDDLSEEILTPSRITCGAVTYCFEKDWLIFTGWENQMSVLYALSIKSKKIQQLSIDNFEVAYPQISPDGSWLLFSSKVNGQYQLFKIEF